eukprot:1162120_1
MQPPFTCNIFWYLLLALVYSICSDSIALERCCQRYRCEIDSSPGGKYTCPQQQHMGKCNTHWMKGYCCQSCPSSCPEDTCIESNATPYLSVDKTTNNFMFNGDYIFLNGANEPWFDYGQDFGGHRHPGITKHFMSTVNKIKISGGNSVRIWIFGEGKHCPIFDRNGRVIKSDATNTLIHDIESHLEIAEDIGIFVILTLWNAAMDFKDDGLYGLLTDDKGDKLQSFIDIVLTPLVEATKDYISLAAWDIINEPEGSVLPHKGTTECTNTIYLKDEGPPWTDTQLTVIKYQRFINKLSAAIKAVDPESLVTMGAWSEKSVTDQFGYKNLWSDACLIEAGGHESGVLDFYDIHSYQYAGFYDKYAPLGDKLNSVRFYNLDKPVVIGEFGIEIHGTPQWEKLAKERYAEEKYKEIYRKGFNGAFMWAMAGMKRVSGSDGPNACMAGMRVLGNLSDVDIDMNDVHGANVWGNIWRVLAVLFTGLLLFGKTCLVFAGCVLFRACCKCCKKGNGMEEDVDGAIEERTGFVEANRHYWYDNKHIVAWCMYMIWILMGIVCGLVMTAGLVCVVVVLIKIEH